MSARQNSRAMLPAAELGRLVLAALVLGTLLAPAAVAYIPSASALLRKTAARMGEGGKSKEATLTGWLSLGEGAPVQAVLSLKFPLDCAFEAGGKRTAVRGDRTGLNIQDDALGPDALELLQLACPLVAYRGLGLQEAEASIRALAQRSGVQPDLSPSSLARLYDRVAIVLGAGARQLDRPQLWLYKETGAPARLLARHGEALDDLRLLEYGNPAAAEWFPRVLELWRGSQLLARFEALEITGFKDVPQKAEEVDDE